MSYVREEGLLRRRRRRRRRTLLSLTLALLLLVLTLLYAVGNVQGIGRPPPTPAAGACSPGRTASGVPLPAPVTVRVNVYNATSRQGLAASLARDLRDQGFVVAKVGNDPRHRMLVGRGEIRYGRAGRAGGAARPDPDGGGQAGQGPPARRHHRPGCRLRVRGAATAAGAPRRDRRRRRRERRGRVLTRRAPVSTGAQDSLGSVATPTAG